MRQESEQARDFNTRYKKAQSEFESIMRCNDPDAVDSIIDRVMYFREDYNTNLSKDITDYAYKLVPQEKDDGIDEEIQKLIALHGSISDMGELLNHQMSKLVALNNKNVVKLTQKGLVNQLSIFSIVLTVLTFVLNNGKLFSFDEISFSMIMAGNVSFVLMCLVMFSIIFLFLHMDDRIKHPVIKAVILGITILALCVLTYFLSTASDRKNDNAILTTNDMVISPPIPIEESFPLPQDPKSDLKP